MKFKKFINKINNGEFLYVNIYYKNVEKLEIFFWKKLFVVEVGGGMVYNSKKEIFFIYCNKKWDLFKGKVEKGEFYEEVVIWEIIEEIGVKDLEVRKFFIKIYYVFKCNGKFKLKIMYWFEMFSDYNGFLIFEFFEGIKKVKWKNFEKF